MIPDTRRRVSIIGAGPAGLALAADLELHGVKTLIYSHPDHARHAEAIVSRGYFRSTGKIEGIVCPLISYRLEDAVDFSDVIIFCVPSTAHDTILQDLGKFNLHQHTIVAVPGNMFTPVAHTYGVQAKCILETNLSPYASRVEKNGDLSVSGKKQSIHISGSTSEHHTLVGFRVLDIFPGVELQWCENAVEVCLANINGVFHPLMNLMNAGRIESTAGSFYLYYDGLTKSVANAIEAVDAVRVQVGIALGFPMRSTLDTSNDCYGHDFVDLVDLAQRSGPHKRLKAPAIVIDRNVSEDVPNVLVVWHDLAEKLGIDASPIKAVILLAGMSAGKDYMETGRSLANLGLAHLSRKELIMQFGGRS